MLNRCGEKVAPSEIDEAFLQHPKVEQAVAFAIPHKTLVEDLAVAVVPRASVSIGEQELRIFAFEYLAGFKVPSRVIFVDHIAKGSTGKLQRIGLAQKLGEHLDVQFVAPDTPLQLALAEIFRDCLRLDKVGVNDNFFDLGGDSLVVNAVMTMMSSLMSTDLSP
jgi:oxalate---CoA ligase